MSRPSPRPGATPASSARPGTTPVNTPTTKRKGPSQEELDRMRTLSASEDTGHVADLNPESASAGRIVNETVTILNAKFKLQDWKRKDGSYPEEAVPEIQMVLSFAREGDEPGDRAYEQAYRYGSPTVFVPSVDGYFANIRPAVIKEGSSKPVPRKTAPAVRFLQSLKAAGGENIIARLGKEGLKALVGLKIHVSMRKTPDMNELAKPVLLVDFIDGIAVPEVQATPAAQAPTNQAPAAAPQAQPAASATSEDASAALLDVLAKAGGSIARAQIPTTLIQISKWKEHPNRGAILKTFKDDGFLNGSPDLWTFDGTTVKTA